jgi:hypothetical protein
MQNAKRLYSHRIIALHAFLSSKGTEFCVWEQLRLRYILGASKLGDDLFFLTSYKYI